MSLRELLIVSLILAIEIVSTKISKGNGHNIPALLIGVPQSGTNCRSPSQTVLLSPNEHENLPVPVALFCGSELSSLTELRAHLQCGIPVVILQVNKSHNEDLRSSDS